MDTKDDNAPMLGGRDSRTGREPRLAGDNALRHLVISLESDDWRVRKAAAEELRQLGPGAATLLIETLRSDNMHTRRVAVQTLGLIGGDEAVEALIGALEDEKPPVRNDAAIGLTRLVGVANSTQQKTILRALLRNIQRYTVDNRTYKDLYAIREDVVLSLCDILLDEDIQTVSVAWRLLEEILWATALQTKTLRAYTMLIAMSDITEQLAPEVLILLRQTRLELVEGFKILLDPETPDERELWQKILSEYPFQKIVPLARVQLSDENPGIRRRAIWWLGLALDTPIAERLTLILHSDPDEFVRHSVVEALLSIQGHASQPAIEKALTHEQTSIVRSSLISGLRTFDENKADDWSLAVVTQDLSPDSNYNVRYWAVDKLIWLILRARDEVSIKAARLLTELMGDDSVDIRGRAVMNAHCLSADMAIPALIERLRDDASSHVFYVGSVQTGRICDFAAKRLEQIGTPKALAAVEAWRRGQTPSE